jgi:DNA invertase Pin-like site-specific DNA recombinase
MKKANLGVDKGADMAKRAAIYLRVSTDEQTTENQERELREVAARSGHEIVAVYRDEGISGAKGRDKRPRFDAMHKDASRRKFDVDMAWSVDRLGRSLQDLIGFLSELHSLGIDLALHQTGHRHYDAGWQGHVSDDGRVR